MQETCVSKGHGFEESRLTFTALLGCSWKLRGLLSTLTNQSCTSKPSSARASTDYADTKSHERMQEKVTSTLPPPQSQKKKERKACLSPLLGG